MSITDVNTNPILPTTTLTGFFDDATISFAPDGVSIYYDDAELGYTTTTFPCDLSASFCITSNNTTDFHQMNVVQYEHEYGTALPLSDFLDANNNITLYSYGYIAERTFQLSTSTGTPIVDPVELYGWYEDGTVVFDSRSVKVTYFDPTTEQDVTVGWTLGSFELYAIARNTSDNYADLDIVQYAEDFGTEIPIGRFYNEDDYPLIFYLVFAVDYDDYFEDTSGRVLIPLNEPDGNVQTGTVAALVYVDGRATSGGSVTSPYQNTDTRTTVMSIISSNGTTLEPQLEFIANDPPALDRYYIVSARYAVYYPNSMAVDYSLTEQLPLLKGYAIGQYQTTDSEGNPITRTSRTDFDGSEITVSKYWTTPTYDRTNGVLYIDFTLLCSPSQISVTGSLTNIGFYVTPTQIVTSNDTANRGGVKVQLVNAWFGVETAQYRANSVVNKIAKDFAARQAQSDEMLAVMDTVNYPDAAEAQELAAMADPFTVVSEEDYEEAVAPFVDIAGSPLIESIMLIAVMFAMISYIMFGKKNA